MKQTQPTAWTDETQDVSTAPIARRSDASGSEAVEIDAGGDFGSDPLAMSSDPFGSTALDMEQKQPTAFTDEAQDTEPDMSSWAAEAGAEDPNHVALEQDPSMWAAEVSEIRACVRDCLLCALTCDVHADARLTSLYHTRVDNQTP
jgi:hypothetical protein